MTQAVIANRFDLKTFDALLGLQDSVAVLDRDAAGLMRYVAINRDSFNDGSLVRITASYALGFEGRGRRIYNLLTLDLQVKEGVATVISARRLGRLAQAAPLVEALIPLAETLAAKRLPDRAQLAAFLPEPLLDILESDLTATDFPEKGSDREERLLESLWDRPAVLRDGKIDLSALSITLNLAVGERAQVTSLDPDTGDCRVVFLGIAAKPEGKVTLSFELHRQGSGFEPRVFNVLTLELGSCDTDGLCPIEAFRSDAEKNVADLSHLLQMLARIAAALQQRQRPDDMLVLLLLSKPARGLWTQTLVAGGMA